MAGLKSNKTKTEGENAIFGKNSKVEENKCTVNSAAMDTVATATSGYERRRGDAGAALSSGLHSPELCRGRGSVGEPWRDLEMAGEGDRGLQTC